MRTGDEALHPHVGLREVVDRRAGGLQDADAPRRLGHGLATDDDPEPLRNGFNPRRAWVIPYGFLT
jgi:hypothetical protein